MTLLLDIGNSRIKVSVTATSNPHQSHQAAFNHHELNLLLSWLQQLPHLPQQALAVNVATAERRQAVANLLQAINCPVHWLDGTTPCSLLHNGYDNPAQLGADRWLALVGIMATLQRDSSFTDQPIVHVSFGTATTIDTILPPNHTQQTAQFIGGLILPGTYLMHQSLAMNTAQLHYDLGEHQAFPTHTQAAISSGIVLAQVSTVLHQWQLTWQQQQQHPLLICSGGGWPTVQKTITQHYQTHQQLLELTPTPIQYMPTPVLDGLNYYAHFSFSSRHH